MYSMEIFANAAGIKLFHCPTRAAGRRDRAARRPGRGGSPRVPAPAIGQIRGGKMRALDQLEQASASPAARDPDLQGVGYDAEFYIWTGVFAPATTPPNLLFKIRNAVIGSGELAEFKRRWRKCRRRGLLDGPSSRKLLESRPRGEVALEKIGKVEEK